MVIKKMIVLDIGFLLIHKYRFWEWIFSIKVLDYYLAS